jgi:Leucine-rich repeat (LRR) protein
LAHRLPIHNAFQLQEATQQLHAARSKVYPNICCLFKTSYPEPEEMDESNAIKILLESLPFTQVGILEVLDLEECKELKDHHLRNICNHVPLLKYLSLRNTDITELPKQIDKLLYLETLDIRQTKVQAFAKSVVLSNLKHLLAGHQNNCKSQNTTNSEEQFATVKMPKSIGTMSELQVLSHVAVFGKGEELIGIGKLLQLRKLGIVLNECEEHIMRHLYRAIEILPGLRSLSIRKTAGRMQK